VPDVRYVCLSDLHFGAENSILTRLDPDTLRVDHTKPSPALEGLLACLRSVTERNEGSRKPTLILAGDIFELALARDNDAAMVFEMFVQQALGPDGIFDSNVYFIPATTIITSGRASARSSTRTMCGRGHPQSNWNRRGM
jgi:hypothetical protein